MSILGEVALDEDGVLHGWCWSPEQPDERRAIDIRIDQELAATLIASRFREDLRFRNYGDGYHGFSVTLTKQLAAASTRSVISAYDRATGICFWQKLFGAFSIPEEFEARVTGLRGTIAELARAPALAPSGAKTPVLASALGQLGENLRARAGFAPAAPLAERPFGLPQPPSPNLALIFEAGADSLAMLTALRLGAKAFAQAKAEILLSDDGADPQTPQRQAAAKNLTYLLAPQDIPARRRNTASAAARASTLVFLHPATPGPAASLTALGHAAVGTLILSGPLADAARRVAPHFCGTLTAFPPTPWPGFILAAPSTLLDAHSGFDTSMDDGAGLDLLDFTLRALRDGAPAMVWRCPWENPPPAAPQNIEAGHRFAERWVMGRF
jgi:hypothetical protein